jgi:predicted DNA-binding transcriptional regulator AlpA
MPNTVRLDEIAKLLGVSKQQAYQLAAEFGFPPPVDRDNHGRMWDRLEVEAWARKWRAAEPWRRDQRG